MKTSPRKFTPSSSGPSAIMPSRCKATCSPEEPCCVCSPWLGGPLEIKSQLASPAMEQDVVVFHIKCVAGRVLTIIDATINAEAQNKALKTLIKKEFREQLERVSKFFLPSNYGCDSGGPEHKEARDLDLSK